MLVSRTLLAAALALALPCARAAPLGAAEAVGRGRWGLEAPRALQQPGEALQRLSPFAAAAPPAPPAPAVDAGAVEEGGLFEGDIILTPDEVEWLESKKANGSTAREGRNLVASRRQLWPGGVVHYDWGSEFSNLTHRRYVLSALKDIEAHSCVRFRKRTSQKTYLLLRNTRSGCAAPVGYVPIGRPIDLYLGQPGCQRRGTVQHEFLHTLGFWHEHTRPDRDQHVTVQWANIKPGLEFNFFVRPAKDVQYLRMPYDYGSVMHYRSVAFSKDGRSHTLEPKEPRAVRHMGQRMRFSKIDLAKLNRLYNCPPHYYRGDDVQIKKKKSSLYGTSVVERISSKEEEETNEEWEGPYPLNTTLELPGVFTLVPPPLPEISTAPPSTEVPKPPKLPTPSPLPAPPATATQPPVSPQPTIIIIPPTQPALPEPTEPPAPIPPPPEPPKLVPIVTVQPAPSSVPEPPSPPDTLKLPGALEPSPLPTPEIIIFPPSPVTEAPFPPLPSIPPPPPLLPLPTLPPHTAPASPIPPPSAAPSPGPEGPVYIVEEKTGECARALQGASGEGPTALAAGRGQRARRAENALGAAGAGANATATALVQLFLHLAGLSPWKLPGAN